MSLIRLHTETIKPPRALWVPFELGRPFGTPGDAALQLRVLRMVLSLLDAPAGPVLEDFPDDVADHGEQEPAVLACPIRLRRRPVGSPDEELMRDVRQEVARLRVWYDLGAERRGRTTVGVSTLEIDAAVDLLLAVFRSELPPSPVPDLPLGDALRLSADDFKAFYLEAVTAQPGPLPSSRELNDWFWQETSGAVFLRKLQSRLAHIPAPDVSEVWLLSADVDELS